MPTYRYLLCDLLTDQPLAQIPLSGVTFGRRISRVGSLSATLNATSAELVTLGRLAYRYAGRSALWVYRDHQLWWGGILWTVQPKQGPRGGVQVSVSAATFDSYAHHRRLYVDKEYLQIDQGVIVPDLWRTIQADPSGDIGMIAEDQPTGTLRDRTYPAIEFPYVGKVIEDLGNVIDGPEHTVDVYLDDDGNRVKRLRVADQLGIAGVSGTTATTKPRFVFQRAAAAGGGTVLEWERTADAVDCGTVFQARGNTTSVEGDVGSEVTAPLSALVERDDLLAQGWPRLDVTEDYSEVSVTSILDGYAQALAQSRGGAEETNGYTLRVGNTGWSPNRLGERVRIKMADDWHSGVDQLVRPVGVDVKPSEKGTDETVTLILGEDEAA